MNSVDLFYNIFKMRFSMEQIKSSFSSRYAVALIGSEADVLRMREWMGDFSLSSGVHPEKCLYTGPIPTDEEEGAQLNKYDAIVCHLGVDLWPLEDLIDLVGILPVGVPLLLVCEPLVWEGEFREYELANLPPVYRLRAGHEAKHFASLMLGNFKQLGLRLARDYQNLRDICIDSLITSSCNRMAVVAAASSITVNVPLLGQMLALLASPVETFAITAEQLRLVLYIGALYGRPLDFFDRVNELWAVVGGGWGWRTISRQLVGLIPGAGAVAKASIAWAGTYFVGMMARRFYELGETLPKPVQLAVLKTAKRKAAAAVGKVLQGESEPELAEQLLPEAKTPEASAAEKAPVTDTEAKGTEKQPANDGANAAAAEQPVKAAEIAAAKKATAEATEPKAAER